MKMENIIIAFLIVVILLTLISIEPEKTGNVLKLPSALGLEIAIYVIFFSLVIILMLLVQRKNYEAF